MSTGRPPPRTARRRPPLTRARVVAAALWLLDHHGLDGLTMRALGTRLGVDPMAVYHHIPSKEALYDAIVEAIWAELRLPTPGGRWQDELADMARELRSVLRSHPHALAIVSTRQNTGAAGLAALDHAIGVLRSAGFGPTEAMRVVTAASSFVIGHALAEAGPAPGGVADIPPDRFEAAATGPANAYPHLAAAIDEGALGGPAMQESFDVGLSLLLAGVEGRLRDRR